MAKSYTHTCKRCGKIFESVKKSRTFCSYACRNIYHFSPDHQPRTTEKMYAAQQRWRENNRSHINNLAKQYWERQAQKPEWKEKTGSATNKNIFEYAMKS